MPSSPVMVAAFTMVHHIFPEGGMHRDIMDTTSVAALSL